MRVATSDVATPMIKRILIYTNGDSGENNSLETSVYKAITTTLTQVATIIITGLKSVIKIKIICCWYNFLLKINQHRPHKLVCLPFNTKLFLTTSNLSVDPED